MALKIYSTGTTIVPLILAKMVGNNHHVGQAEVYVSARTKAEALALLRRYELSPSSARNLKLAVGNTVNALYHAGVFADETPKALVAHRNGSGPVVQVGTETGSVVIGELIHSRPETTLADGLRITESNLRFVPAVTPPSACTSSN